MKVVARAIQTSDAMDVGESYKQVLVLFLIVGGEELQKLIETLPEQPTDYKWHIQKLNNHFEAHRNDTLELYKFFNIGPPSYRSWTLKGSAGNKSYTASSRFL